MRNRIGYTSGSILGAMFAIASAGLLFSCVNAEEELILDEEELRSGPVQMDGNPKCTDLDADYLEVHFNAPQNGVTTIDGVTIDVTNKTYFDWTSKFPIKAVIAKGGYNGANVYYNYPPAKEDTYLTTPTEQELSHISFCYKHSLVVSKTAETSFKRKWTWTIDKQLVYPAEPHLLLKLWQSILLEYKIVVDAESEDSHFKVEGKITIHNPSYVKAIITSVVDQISDFGGPVYVDCGVTFPYELPAGKTLYCDYNAMLPDGSYRKNTATVTTKGKVDGGSGMADIKFSDTPDEKKDECVTVYDLNNIDGETVKLGEVCKMDETFEREIYYKAKECDPPDIVNKAWLETNDTNTTDYDKVVIDVEVACEHGCTLTQGYWKTHSEKGPAPYDETWAELPDGAKTPFFSTGKSWHEVFWTPPAGNACISLAHQWMAAKLNYLAGASLYSVQTEFDAAKYILEGLNYKFGKCPKEAGKLADKLDKYNNGYVGPGHCDE